MRHHTRLVNLSDDQCAVFTCELHIDSVDPDNLDLAAPDGLTSDRQTISVHSRNVHIRRIRMICLRFFIDDKFILYSHLFGPFNGISDPGVIRMKAKDPPQKRPVGPMSMVSLGKRSVQCKDNLSYRLRTHLTCQKRHGTCSRRM